jgi:uncharacterized protein
VTIVSRAIVAVMVFLIRVYQRAISPCLPRVCRFEPSCSQYFIEALHKRGVLMGALLGCYRILRCNPFGGSGYDPVPDKPSQTPLPPG